MDSGDEAEAPAPRRTRRSTAASQDGAGEGMPFQIARSVLLGGQDHTHIDIACKALLGLRSATVAVAAPGLSE